MLYFSNVWNIVVVGLFPAFFVFPTKCLVNMICPPNAAYLEKRNSCAFFIESCGNFSNSRQLCTDENAYLVGLTTSSEHLNELCQFAKTRISNESSFYLNSYRNKNNFHRGLNNSREEEDEGHKCIEMIVSEPDCLLKYSPCDELKWPLCELPHANPCAYNKGGCEGECFPRYRGNRMCMCPRNKIAVGTKCFIRKNITETGCYEPFTHYPEENRCVWLMEEKINLEEHVSTCDNIFYRSNTQTAVSNMRTGLPFLDDLTWVDFICPHIDPIKKDSRYYFVNGGFNGAIQNFTRVGTGHVPRSRLCGGNVAKHTYNNYCMCIYKYLDGRCCITPIWCINRPEYAICETQPVLLTRPDNNDQENCYWNNGGCLHICVMLFDGGRKCMCWQGFELVNDTECRYKDRCLGNAGEPGCPTSTKLSFIVNRTCEIAKENNTKTSTEIEETTGFNFGIFNVIMGCFVILVCCLAVLLHKKRF